jgi:glutamyl-tRNA reductase
MVELIKIGTECKIGERETFLLNLKAKVENDGVLLQTCNRVEFYSGSGIISDEITRHLFRVVSGLESTIIGESAIVGQVKQAYFNATQNNRLDKSLHKLFQYSLFVGKRVRKETGISKGAMSHSQAAVDFLFKEIGDIKSLKITVIGVNALNEKIIKFLIKKDTEPVFIGNRTFAKANELAEKYGAKAFHFDQLSTILEKTDVLISATAAPHFILKKENFNAQRKMYILDLAVPRDIDPAIGELPNVNLFDIEFIENQIKKNLSVRNEKLSEAESIIDDEVKIFSYKNVYEQELPTYFD